MTKLSSFIDRQVYVEGLLKPAVVLIIFTNGDAHVTVYGDRQRRAIVLMNLEAVFVDENVIR